MFSIKQFLINSSSEVRQEIRKLIDEIEASIPTETLDPTPAQAPAAEIEANAPTETLDTTLAPAPAAEVNAAPIETEAKAVEADASAEE